MVANVGEGMDPDTGRSQKKLSIYVQTIDKIVDLSLQLSIGSLNDKIWALEMMAVTAYQNQDEDRLEKAKMQLKKVAEDTKLKNVMKCYGGAMRKYDMMDVRKCNLMRYDAMR